MLAEAVAAELGHEARTRSCSVCPAAGCRWPLPWPTALGAPLDVLAVRKVGTPGHIELAIGAVASGGLVVRNEDLIYQLGLDERDVAHRVEVARRELEEQERRLRGDRPRPSLDGRTVVIVDDGMATGATMRAAVAAVRTAAPAQVVVAVPVAPPDTCDELARVADRVVCPYRPDGVLGRRPVVRRLLGDHGRRRAPLLTGR